ncbi:unnamed protein product [Calypogeia fissa]
MAAGRNHTSPLSLATAGGGVSSSSGGKSRISSTSSASAASFLAGGGEKLSSGLVGGGGSGGGRDRDHGGGGGRDYEAFDRDLDRERSRSEGYSARDVARDRDRDRDRDRGNHVSSVGNHHSVRDGGRDAIGRDLSRDAGRDGGRDAGRDAGRDFVRDVGRDFVRDGGRDAGRDGARDVGRDAGRDSIRDVGRDAGRDGARDVGREAGRDGARDVGRDAGRDAGVRDVGRDAGRDGGIKDVGRDAGRDGVRDGGRDVGRDGLRNGGRDAGRDIARDAGRDVGRDGGRDAGRDPARDAARDLGRDSGRDAGRDGARDIGRETGRDLLRDAGRDAGGRDVERDYRSRNLIRDDISARDSLLARESSREGAGGGGYGKEKDRSDRNRDWEPSSDRGRGGGEKMDRDRDLRERDKRERDLISSRERDLNGSRSRDLSSSRERDLSSSRHVQQRRHVGTEAAAEGVGGAAAGGDRAPSPLLFGRPPSAGSGGGSVTLSTVRSSVSPASDGLLDKETNSLGETRISGAVRLPSGKDVEREPGELPSLGRRVEEISWRADVSVMSSLHSRNSRNNNNNNNSINKPASATETAGGGGGGNRSSSPTKKRKFSPIVWDYDEKQARPSSNKVSSSGTGASSSVSLSGSKFGSGSSQPAQASLAQSSVQVLSSPATSNENLSSPPSKPPSSGRATPLGSTGGHRVQGLSMSPQDSTPSPVSERIRGSPLAAEIHSQKGTPDVQMQEQVMASSMSDDEPEPGQLLPEPDESTPQRASPGRIEEDMEENAPSPIITIAASRWAGETNTPERGRSPRGGVGKARKRSSSLDSEEGLLSSGQDGGHVTSGRSTSPEPGEYIQEKADVAPRTKERGTDSDGSVGRGSDGKGRRSRSIEDEEYERELNKRELMELDEEDSDIDDQEEQRPEVDPEYDDVPPTPAQPISRAIDMLQGCRSVDEFERLNRIDEGTYGVVYRARNRKTGEIVALKKVKMEKEKEGFPLTSLREINVLLSFHHPSVVDVKEVVVGSTIDSIFMVMEYMEHDLKGLMETMKQPFSQSEVKCLMLQLFEGVKYLHDNWVLHRDLKTSNLLMNNRGELKICDFGLARQYGSPLKAYTNMVVTLWYRAPELLLGPKNYQYSTAIDMWSLGCIMAEFLAKEPLFNGKSEIDQIDKIFKTLGTPNEKIWPEFPKLPGVKCNFVRQPYNKLRERFPATAFAGRPTLSENGFDLLNRLLTYDPQKRITADEALRHDWFREVPLPKSKEFMPTFPARSEHDRRVRRLMKSPDPLEEQRKRELRQGELGGGGLFG